MIKLTTLHEILMIPESSVPDPLLDMTGLSHELKIQRWKDIVAFSLADRRQYSLTQQKQNKWDRLRILDLADENEKIRNRLRADFTSDPLLFFNLVLWTYNPRLNEPHLPFILYPFQEKFVLDMIESIEL